MTEPLAAASSPHVFTPGLAPCDFCRGVGWLAKYKRCEMCRGTGRMRVIIVSDKPVPDPEKPS